MRVVHTLGSPRIFFMPSRSSSRSRTLLKISSLGSGMLMNGCITGRATLFIIRWIGKMRLRYHLATSGNASSCSVSPVGAQSTMSTSNLPSRLCFLIHMRLATSSIPGGDAISSATMSSTPCEAKSDVR